MVVQRLSLHVVILFIIKRWKLRSKEKDFYTGKEDVFCKEVLNRTNAAKLEVSCMFV